MYPDMAKKEGLCSLVSVPMMVREKAVGVINSYTSVPHVFTSEEVKLLQAIANQAAIAIEHTTLIEKSFEMQEALAVRKLMERAKGYLMRSKKLTEEEAFKLIQRQSMDLRKSMREIAEAVLLAGELDQRAEKQRGIDSAYTGRGRAKRETSKTCAKGAVRSSEHFSLQPIPRPLRPFTIPPAASLVPPFPLVAHRSRHGAWRLQQKHP